MTDPNDAKHTRASDTDAESWEVSGSTEQNGGRGRMPYEAPRMTTGDIFERIVMTSHSSPTGEECG